MEQLDFTRGEIDGFAISPFLELGAYEALWDVAETSFKKLSEQFAKTPDPRPSELVEAHIALEYANRAREILLKAGIDRYGVRVFGAGEYPQRLRDAKYPCQIIYYQGWWELINSPRIISIVGSRKPSEDGIRRASRIVRILVEEDYTIMSGLAGGIDTAAHTETIRLGGRTIAVLGTPLSKSYPSKNADLQREIAKNHLLISQVPIVRYEKSKNPTVNRFFFPERNVTMSALSDATIIVEAGETSGTLTQARAALSQGRKLFILNSCFEDKSLKWPADFEKKGAIRVINIKDILNEMPSV